MARLRAVRSTIGSARQCETPLPATRRRLAQPVETRAREYHSRTLPAGQATPQCLCSTAHLRIDPNWNFRGFKGADGWNHTLVAPISLPNAILIMMAETAEEISRKPEIRKELQRATGEKRSEKVKARGTDKFWFVVHALVLAGCVAAYFLLGFKLVPLPQSILGWVGRILRGT